MKLLLMISVFFTWSASSFALTSTSFTSRTATAFVPGNPDHEHEQKRRFLFPCNPLNPKQADEPFQDEFLALKEAGAECSLFDFDELAFGFKPKPRIDPTETVLYRGWMLSPTKYAGLVEKIEANGAKALTTVEDYTKCHHLPGWYDICKEFTPETVCFPHDETLQENIAKLNWDRYFVKDYVKSNTSGPGSIANSVDEAIAIVNLIETYRGEVEGGVAVRQVEDFVPNTEQRYFVLGQQAYALDGKVPEMVEEVAAIIQDAPFYSVDTVLRQDGTLRLVEIGDGQVSDKKTWPLDRFVAMLVG